MLDKLKLKIDFSKSKGSYLYSNGKKYIDLCGHYSSCALGYNHDIFDNKFREDILSVAPIRVSNGIYNSDFKEMFIEKFTDFAVPKGYKYLHFSSTGSLAIEAALKTAWHNKKFSEVCCFKNSFHGIYGMSNFITDSDTFFDRFDNQPYGFNDTKECFKATTIDDLFTYNAFNTHTVIIEPVQCSAGDIYYDRKDLVSLSDLCNRGRKVLIYDEIQTGFGITGKVWYSQHFKLRPDIIVFGKKSQVSGIMIKDKLGSIFKRIGIKCLSATFDGELMDMIRCSYIIDAIKKYNLLEHITKMGGLFLSELKSITELKNVRGIGGLIAFDLETKTIRNKFFRKAYSKGLIVNPTAEKTIRVRPSLAITEEEIQGAIKLIKKSV